MAICVTVYKSHIISKNPKIYCKSTQIIPPPFTDEEIHNKVITCPGFTLISTEEAGSKTDYQSEISRIPSTIVLQTL